MKEFSRVQLREVVFIKGGKRLPLGEDFSTQKTSHPYIRARDIGYGNIRVQDAVYLSDEIAQKLSRYRVSKGDVCITIVGANVGEMGVVPPELNGANLTENAVRITSNGKIVQGFLKYTLLAQDALAQMKVLAGGAAQPKLGIYKIETIEIPLPSLPKQRKIAAILSAYDDLIDNNLRRIKILEEMTQNLYREWFVKFRFPGHQHARFTDSLLGPIPEGWEVRELSEFVDFERGVEPGSKKYASQPAENYVPFLRVGDLGKRTSDLFIEKSFAKGRILTPDDTAITMDGTVGLVSMGLTGAYSSGIRRVVPKSNCTIGNAFVFLLLQSEHIQAIIESHAKGTTIKHASSSIGHMIFVLPDKAVADAFEEHAGPLNSLALSLGRRNDALRRTRDLLLPRLISGEVDVSELDIAIPKEAGA